VGDVAKLEAIDADGPCQGEVPNEAWTSALQGIERHRSVQHQKVLIDGEDRQIPLDP